jgi:aldehyde dehydrogenase (NAD+)
MPTLVHVDVERIFALQKANQPRVAQTSAAQRAAKLRQLRDAIFASLTDLQQAIFDDFRKNAAEVHLTETHLVIGELNDAIRNLPRWMKPKRVKTPLVLFGTRSEIRYQPKGVVLILSPWNYPFQLALSPVIAAVAAGNCFVLKPSNKTPHCAAFIRRLLAKVFDEDEVAVIEGDHTVAEALLEFPFDHIFFTGSTGVGRKIMAAAAKHLVPVTLELGGKSPAIVDDTADIRKAAERIVWGKFINAGQTCVAPDYLLIHANQAGRFIEEAKKVIAARYGSDAGSQAQNADYCRVISDAHQQTLMKLLQQSVREGARIETGGVAGEDRFVAPTILSGVAEHSEIMREEIFGPILPVVTYTSLDDAIALVRRKDKPLALYVFSQNEDNIRRILASTTSGGACVNSLVVHLANPNLPFGGVGMSGMGNYHGFFGFRTFSHERAVLRQGGIDVVRLFYPPYTPRLKKLIELITRYAA